MDVLMPQLGETVREGKILAWFKTVGEAITPGDNLFEVETDKVTVEVPATAAGVVSDIRVDAGDSAAVGAVVAVISPADGVVVPAPTSVVATTAAPPAPAEIRPPDPAAPLPLAVVLDPFREVRTPTRNFGPARLPNGARITPLARRRAAEAGIVPEALNGVGANENGRVRARDVEAAIAHAAMGAASEALGDETAALFRDMPLTEVPLTPARRATAARLARALRTVPQIDLTAEVDVDRLLALRREINAARGGEGIGLTAFLVKALAIALTRVPEANAAWAEDRLLRFARSDIAVAVEGGEGGAMPVVRRAERLMVSALDRELRDLAGRARAGTLTPDDTRGGASGLVNVGSQGPQAFAATLVPPLATMLTVGAASRRPVETTGDGGIRFASRVTLTLSCDQRVVDARHGMALLAAIKELVENPMAILV